MQSRWTRRDWNWLLEPGGEPTECSFLDVTWRADFFHRGEKGKWLHLLKNNAGEPNYQVTIQTARLRESHLHNLICTAPISKQPTTTIEHRHPHTTNHECVGKTTP